MDRPRIRAPNIRVFHRRDAFSLTEFAGWESPRQVRDDRKVEVGFASPLPLSTLADHRLGWRTLADSAM
jgi:hypothetical protein